MRLDGFTDYVRPGAPTLSQSGLLSTLGSQGLVGSIDSPRGTLWESERTISPWRECWHTWRTCLAVFRECLRLFPGLRYLVGLF